MSDLPDWTPGPGAYTLTTDFNKRTQEKHIAGETEEAPEIVEIVPRWD